MRTRMIALEPRMLFDGALGIDLATKATAVVTADSSQATSAPPDNLAPASPDTSKDSSAAASPAAPTDSSTAVVAAAQTAQSASATPAEKDAVQKPGAEALDAATQKATPKEVVFVDSRVTNYQSQLVGVDPNATIVMLDASKDGLTQIADAMANYSDVTAVHIIAEGSADQLLLGSGTLDASSMNGLGAQRLSSISSHITADAKILVHGDTDFGTGSSGSAVADRLALLTSADVADVTADGTVQSVGAPARQEIVFVDPNVADFQTLVDGIDNPNARIVLLDDSQDGVQQILDVVQQYTRVDAIHIISHGSEGQIDLASGAINSTTIAGEYAAQLAAIGTHLSADADVLIYGCNFGKGDDGAQAAQQLARLTGADVAASVDDTGDAAMGGNWSLERQTGTIDTGIVIDASAREAYHDVLALHTLDFDTAPAWTAGAASTTYTVDGYPVTVSVSPATSGDPVQSNSYTGGVSPAQNALQFTLGATGSNTITIDFSGQPGGGVANVGFALWDVDNAESASFTATKTDGTTVISPTQIATSQYNHITAGTPGSGTSVTVAGTGSDSTATTPQGNVYVYFNTSDIKTVSFTYNGTANTTLVVLNDITFMGKTNNPPLVDLDASTGGTQTVGDNFVAQSYSDASTGAIPWNGSWVETDSTAGQSPTAGQVQVVDTPTAGTDYGLRLNNSGTAAQTTGAARAIDLSQYYAATLTYNYVSSGGLGANDIIAVEVSSNGGTNWTLLKTYTGSTASTTTYSSDSLNLSGYESANTMVRFRVSGTGSYTGATSYFYVDNVQISGTPTGSSNAYTEGDNTGVLIAATANASVTDVDSTNMSSSRVAIGSFVAGDQLTFSTAGTSITGSYDSSTGVLSLSGADTKAHYAQVIDTIRYLSSSDDPTVGGTVATRSIAVTVRDDTGNESSAAISAITVTGVNDAPTLTATASNPTFQEAAGLGTQAAAVSVFSGTAVSTIETGQTLTEVDFTVSGLVDGANEKISVDGTAITLGANSSGTTATNAMGYTVNISGGTATIVLTKAAGISSANAQTLVNGITYQDTLTDNPTAGNRIFTLTKIKDNGGTANGGFDTTTLAVASTVSVLGVNDAPAGTNKTISIPNSATYTFTAADFGFSDVDGNNFSSVIITSLPGGTALVKDNGVTLTAGAVVSIADITSGKLQYIADAGNRTFTFQVQDDGGTANSGQNTDQSANTFTMNTPANNTAPVWNAAASNFTTITEAQTNNAGQLVSVIMGSVTDPDAGAVNGIAITTTAATNGAWQYSVDGGTTWTAIGAVANNSALLLRSTDMVRFNPTGFAAASSITYRAWDQTSGMTGTKVDASTNGGTTAFSTTTHASSITVNDVAPTITSSTTTTVAEGTNTATVVYTASATDYEAVSFSLSGTDAGAFNINSATGAVTFKAIPDYETKTSYSFNVVASDGTMNSTQAVTISVSDVAPTVTSATTATVAEGTSTATVVYTASATDPAGGTVTYSLTGTDAASFNINSSTGAVTFVASPDYETKTSYSINVKASDPSGAFNTQAVTVNITDVAPTISSATTATVAEGTSTATVVYTAAATDVNGGTVTYALTGTDAASFNINSSTGAVTFVASPDYETKSSYSINVKASDASGANNVQAVTINVSDVAPTITSATTATVVEGTSTATVVYTAAATDVNGGTVTYNLTGADAASFNINSSTGAVTFVASPDYETKTSYSINVKASDPSGSFNTQAVTVNITDVAPTVTSATTATVPEGTSTATVVYTATATDPAGGTITYSLTGTDAASFNINSSTGAVTFVASPNYETKTSYSINVKASDPSGANNVQAVTINVSDVAPTITSATTATVVEGTSTATVVYTAAATDVNGGTVTYSLTGTDAAAFNINSSTGAVTFVASPDYETKTSYSINVKASDPSGAFNTQAVTVNISDVAPTITSSTTATVAEGTSTATVVYTAAATDVNGGTVTYSLTGADAASFSINSSTGAVTFVASPDYETKSSYSINVKASDPSGAFNTQAVTVNVTDVAPTITSATTTTVVEGTSTATVVYTAAATDVNGGTVTYSLTGADAASFSINSSTGAVTFVASPDYETKTSYSINVKASDPSGAFNTQAVTVNITDVAPTITSATTATVAEGTSTATVVYTASATDPAGGTVTYSLTGADAASFNINSSTGAVTFVASPDYETKSSYSINVKASDPSGANNVQAVTINVSDVAPTITSATTATVVEGTSTATVVYTASATDVNGGTVTYSLTGADAASFSINSSTGAVTFVASPDYETKTSYSINVKASDPSGAFNTQAVTVNVTDVAPSITSATTATVAEGTSTATVVYTASATDPAGGTVTYSLTGTDAAAFNINSSTGAVTFVASPDYETKTSYSINVKASDPSGAFNTQAVTVNISDVAPTISSATTATVVEGTSTATVVYTAAATDVNGGTVTYSLTGADAAAFSINSSTGAVTFVASPDYETKTSYSINVKASDPSGAFNTQAVTVNITDVAPTITSATTATVAEGTSTATVVYTASATDPAGGTVTYSLTGTDAAAFSINSSTGAVTFVASPDYETKTSYSINVKASDPSGANNVQAVTINVTDVAPTITSATTATVVEGTSTATVVYTAAATDIAGGTVTYSLTGTDAASFSINSSTGAVTFVASPDYETKTSYSINVKASDPSGAFNTQAVTVNITDVAPTITSATTATVAEGTTTATTVYTASATDPAGGTVTYSLTGTDAASFTINSATGAVKFVASPDYETKSSYSINVKASDPSGANNVQAVTINISDVAPTITSATTASVVEGTSTATVVYTAAATDVNGGTVTYSLTGADAASFSINSSTGAVTFVASPDYETKSSYSINVKASDPSGAFNTQAVTVNITDVAPTITSATTATVAEGTSTATVVYTAAATDVNGGTVTYSLTGADAASFNINSSTGAVTFVASPDYETKTSYSINVKASDPSGAFNTQAVTVNVTDVAPTITSATTATVAEGTSTATVVYTASATDPAGGTVTYSLTGADAAAFNINSSTGAVTFVASPDYETKTSYSINVKASDPSGANNVQAVTVNITDVAPTITSATTATVAEGTSTATVVYTAAATDVNGGTVTYSLTGADAAAFSINSSTGAVTFVASPDYETKTSYSINVKASDPSGAFNTQAVTVNVTDVAPTITSATTATVAEGTSTATVVYTASATDVNGGTVTYSLTGADAASFNINSSTGAVTFVASPDYETKSSYSINVKASDPSGANNVQAVTINISDVAPTITSATTATVVEGTSTATVVYTAAATDVNGGTVTYSLTGADAASFNINSSTGAVTFVASPDYETKTSYSINVKASDPSGSFNTQAVTVNITDVAPTITSATAATVPEGTSTATTVYTASATDPAGGTVTYTLTGTDAASFSINSSTGAVTFVSSPDYETKTSYSINVKASDPSGANNVQAVTINISDVAPTITSATTATVAEGTSTATTVYTASATDPAGGTVTYSLTGADAASFNINSSTGAVTFVASPDYETKSSYSITVKASDPSGANNVQAVTINVTDVAPTITSATTATVAEGTSTATVVYTAAATDVNGGTVTYTLTGADAASFNINSSTGAVTFVSSPDFETKSSYSINVKASDPSGANNVQAVTINVTDVAPTITSATTATVVEGTSTATVVYTAAATDVNGGTVTYSLTGADAASFNINSSTGAVTFVASPDYETKTSYAINVKASDPSGAFNNQAVTVNITDVAPTITSATTATVAEGTSTATVVYTAAATDVNGGTVTYTLTGADAASFNINSSTGAVTFVSSPDFETKSSYSINVKASDPSGANNVQAVTINVTDVAPTITSATTATVAEGTSTATVVYTASATDPAGGTVTYSLTGADAASFNINSSTGAVTFVASPDYETKSSYSINVKASDPSGANNIQAVTINVTDVAPTITSATTATVAEGTSTATAVYTASATDPAGGTVTYSLTGADAASFNINSSTGAVTFVASPDYETKSSYSINVKASDPSGAFNTQAVTVNITDVAPTITSATTATVAEGTSTATVVYTASATDPAGGTVTYSLTGADAASFSINSSTGAVTFVASPDYETKSSYSINVKASDPSGANNVQAVTINVTDVAPTISSATTATVAEGTSTATVVYTAAATDVNGGTVTYSLTGADAAAFNINSSTGAVTFVASPDYETKNSYSINVKASDPSGAFNTQAVTVNVTDVAPSITSATTATVAEGASTATVVYTASATDPAGGTVTYSLTGADAAAFNINSSTGAVTFVASPDYETKSSYSINVKASDPSGANNIQAVTINVTDVAPTITSATTATVVEGTSTATVVYTAAATDVNGGTVTYSLTGADAASFSINSSTGAVTFVASPDFETKSSYSINVKASDPSGAFNTQAVTVNITDVAPTITSATTATVAEGTSTATVVYTAAATDPAGGTVTYSLTGADAAAFNINSSTGAVTFVASPDYETKSSYSINVKASDPSGANNVQAVTINISDVAPTISSSTTATVAEGISTATVVYTAAATDVNGGTVTYALTGADAAAFSINSSTGAVTFVASPDYETKSSYSINVKASDASGAFNTQAVTINVTDVAPTITSATTATVAEGTSTATVVYTAAATDVNGGTVTYSLTGADAAAFNINSSTGAVTFVASPDFETKTSYSINVKASDPSGANNVQAVTINVTDVAPTITSATTATVVEGTTTSTVVYTAAATDPAGGTVTYSLTGADAASFSINASTGAVTFVASPDYETKTSYSINVKAADASGAFNTQAVTVNVTDVAPTISSATTATVAEGTTTSTVIYTAAATDVNGGTVTYSLTGADAAAFNINASTGAVTFVASPDFETKSSYSINVKASDPSGANNVQAVTINVTDVAPTVTSATTATVAEGTSTATVVYTAAATDVNGGTVTYSLTGADAAAFNINSSTGAVTFVASPDYETKTSYSINVKASDPSGAFNTQAVTINVTDVAPTITSTTTATVAEGTSTSTVVYTAAATDVNGGTVTYSLTGADAAAFNIDSSTGAVTFVASPDYETKTGYSINVKASDPSGANNVQAVTINITDVAPTITSSTTTTVVEGTPTSTVVYAAAATDVNGGTVTYSLTGADAAAFNINSSTGAVTFVASPDYETKTSYSINVKASDPSGAFNTQAVTINVTDVAPTITSSTTATVAEGTSTATVVYTAVATDVSGGTVTYSLTGADAASFSINSSTGAVTFISSPDFETKSSYSINVKASDPSGANNVQAVTINITDVAPTITSATTTTVPENTSTSTVVYTAAATDVNGGTVTYSLTGADAAAFNINSSTGAITFVVSPDYETKSSYSINVKASDPSGANNLQAVTINITNVNEAPSGTNATVAILENVTYTFAAGDFGFSDPDAGDTLAAVRIDSVPAAGTLVLAGSGPVSAGQVVTRADIDSGKLQYTPALNGSGAGYASVGFSVSDGTLFDVAPNTITVDVGWVNHAPTITSGTAVAVAEGISASTVVYTGTATDLDGDTVTWSLSGADAGAFSVNAATGAVTFNASPDFETKSSYSFNVVAFDGTITSNQGVTVSVTDVAPSITSATSVSVPEGTATSTTVYTAAATDVQGGAVSFSLSGADASAFSINTATGEVTFNASPDYETKSSYSFNVVASDGTLASSQAVTVSIADIAPSITSSTSVSVPEGTNTSTTVYTAAATDVQGGAVTFSLTGADAAAFSVDATTGAVTFNSSPDYETKSSYSFNVVASDGTLSSNQAVTISVTDVAPTITSATTVSVAEGTSASAVIYTAAANDVQGGAVSFTLTGADAGAFTINASTGEVTFNASPDYETKSSYSFNVAASDGTISSSQAVTVSITDVAPTITSSTSVSVPEGTNTSTVVYSAAATDVQGGAVTFSLSGADAAAFSVDATTGAVTFNASPDYETKSAYSINIVASDGTLTSSQAVTVSITDVAPTITSATAVSVAEGTATSTVVYTASATDVQGGAVSFSLTGADAAAFTVNAATGQVTFNASPDYETKSAYTFNVVASDGTLASSQAVTVSVTDVAPAITSATTVSVPEGTGTAAVIYTAAATDVQGGAVSFTLSGADASAFAINSSTGAVTFNASPDFETKPSYIFNVVASDGTLTSSQSVTVSVTDVAPTITSATTVSVAEGTATSTVVYTAAATDPAGGAVSFTLSGADAAAFTINPATGKVTFNASPDYETKSSYSFNVVASDGTLSSSQAVTVSVADVAPTITSATTVSVPEGTATSTVVYTAAASDPAGGAVSFSLSGADAGAFTINSSTGQVTFNASPDYETKASYSIDVVASDGTLGSTQAVTVAVTDVAPTISSATSVSVPEGTGTAAVIYTAAATDVQGGAVSFTLSGADASAFTINASTGAVTFNASPDYETKSSYSFNVVASDGTLASSQAVTVAVTDVAPTITSATSVSVPEGTSTATVVYTGTAVDPSGGAISFSLTGADAAAFTINSSTGAVTFNASPDYETKSSYSFNVVASDGTLASSQAVTVAVTDVAPTITSATSVSVPEGTATSTVVYAAAASDPAGGAVSFSLTGADAGAFTINSSTGAVTFNASPDYETKSAYTFNVVASDGTVSSSQAVSVSVTDVAPTVTSASSVSVPEGTATATVIYTATATDVQGGAVSFSLSGADASAFTINSSTGAVTFNASPDYETKSSYNFNVVASDGTLSSSHAMTVSVTDLAPTITSATTVSVAEGTSTAAVVYTATAVDPQGGAISYSLTGADAAAFSVNAATGAVTFNASPDYETKSSYSFSVVASDGTLSSNQAVTVSITDVAPTVTSATAVSVAEGTSTSTVVYTATANDPAGGAVSFSLAGADAAAFSINAATGQVTFNASPDYETKSSYSFNVVASDGTLTSSQGVTVSVTDVAPTITSATSVSVPEGTAAATVIYTAAATDVQGGAVSFSLAGADAAAFTINPATGAVTFNASPDYETKSSYSFSVVASDGTISSSQAVTVSITDVAPAITSATTVSVPEGTATSTVVYTAAATDVQGGAVSFSLSGADASAFSINTATGAVKFNASPNFETKSSYSFNVVASDGTMSSNQAVTVSVTDVAPTITSATTVSVSEGAATSTVVYTAAANDVQGGAVSFSLSGADAAAFTINPATGAVRFNASPDYETKSSYSFNVVASDGTLTSSQAVTVSITDVAPTITSATSVSVPEGTGTATVIYTAAATDVQGGAVSFTLTGADAAAFTINPATGAVTFNASPDYETKSSYSFNVVASDGTINSSQAVTVSITDVAPTITSATSVSVAENTPTSTVIYTAAANDVQGGAVSFSLTGADAAAFTINPATGAVTFNASPDFETKSSYTFNVIASDGTTASSQAVTVSITNVNEAPVVTSPAASSFTENTTGVVYTATRFDADAGDTVVWTLSGADAGLFSVNPATGAVTVLASHSLAVPGDANADGVYDITLTATDSGGLSASRAVQLTLAPVAAPVVAAPAPSQPTPATPPGFAERPATAQPVAPVAPSIDSPASGPVFGHLPLGQPVDPSVDRSSFGSIAGAAPAAERAFNLADLNALPPTAAGLDGSFNVERLSLADALRVPSVADSGFVIGGHRLFVYQGIPDMQLLPDATGSVRVPQDAFAHTDPAAIVRLEARLTNGLPLPSWLKFDAASGSFDGVPPEGMTGLLDIEVIARDTEGREAHSRFSLELSDLRVGEALPDLPLGLDVDGKEKEKARLEAAKQAARAKAGADAKPGKQPTASFSDQLRTARAPKDPLLDRITGAGSTPPRDRR